MLFSGLWHMTEVCFQNALIYIYIYIHRSICWPVVSFRVPLGVTSF